MDKNDTKKLLDAMAECAYDPYQLASQVFVYPYGDREGKRPRILPSDEDPPRKIKNSGELISIDETLGRYSPVKDEITIYNKGINEASETLGCTPKSLKEIVLIHEHSHALINMDTKIRIILANAHDDIQMQSILEECTIRFESIGKRLNEHLAQLLTYLAIKIKFEEVRQRQSKQKFSRLIDLFESLNHRQPPDYVVDEYKDISRIKLIQSIQLLKSGGLNGFETWDTVIRW